MFRLLRNRKMFFDLTNGRIDNKMYTDKDLGDLETSTL